VTENTSGLGTAFYLGTDADDAFLRDFYSQICARRNIVPLAPAQEQVEIVERTGEGRRLVFVMNHAGVAREVNLDRLSGRDLLTNRVVKDRIQLPAYGVAVLELD
jgi:beta-galactosidase